MTNRRLRRALGLLPLALVLALPATPASAGAPACAAANASPEDSGAAQLEHTVLCLVNRERAAHGLPRLRSNDRLDRAARGHSRHMVSANFFDHDSPGGASVVERVKRRGYMGRMVGENIAWGSGSYATPGEIVDGWMNSAGHRANILHRGFKEIGVGVAIGAPRPTFGMPAATYTTDFGTRR